MIDMNEIKLIYSYIYYIKYTSTQAGNKTPGSCEAAGRGKCLTCMAAQACLAGVSVTA